MEPIALTVPEVAEALRVNPKTIYALIKRGELRAKRVGLHKLRVAPAELDRYLKRTTPGAA